MSDQYELELVTLCVGEQISLIKSNEKKIRLLFKKDINWNHFLSIVSLNRVNSLVWKSINPFIKETPKSITKSLFDNNFAISIHNFSTLKQLQHLNLIFSEHDIQVIFFKGAIIGSYYTNLALREWSDIDILIKKEDFFKVKKIFLAAGYQDGHLLDDLKTRSLFETGHSCNFLKKDTNISVDVHWRFEDAFDKVNFSIDRIWKRAVKRSVYGHKVLTLCPEDLILLICFHHGYRDLWNELRLIADLAVIVDFEKQLNWQEIIDVSTELGIKKALLVGISLSNLLFKTPIPSIVNCAILKDKSIKKLETLFYNNLNKNKSKSQQLFYNFKVGIDIKDGNLYTKLLLYSNVFKPTPQDLNQIVLSSKLYYLYYFIRPIRLIIKHGLSYLTGRLKEL